MRSQEWPVDLGRYRRVERPCYRVEVLELIPHLPHSRLDRPSHRETEIGNVRTVSTRLALPLNPRPLELGTSTLHRRSSSSVNGSANANVSVIVIDRGMKEG